MKFKLSPRALFSICDEERARILRHIVLAARSEKAAMWRHARAHAPRKAFERRWHIKGLLYGAHLVRDW